MREDSHMYRSVTLDINSYNEMVEELRQTTEAYREEQS